MPIILETERLILRTWLLNDLKDFYAIYGDKEVWRYVDPKGVLKNEDAGRRPLQRATTQQHEHGFCQWAVVEKRRGKVVGACGFNFFEGGPHLELIFHIARLHWGSGFATEAARACLTYAFEKLKAPGVVATVDPQNLASRRVLEKIGLIQQASRRVKASEEIIYVAAAPEATE